MKVIIRTLFIHVNHIEQCLLKSRQFLIAQKILPLVITTLTTITMTTIMTTPCHACISVTQSTVCGILFNDFQVATNDNNLHNAQFSLLYILNILGHQIPK